MTRVALVCGRYRPDLDGVAGYVAQLAGRLPDVGVAPEVHDAPDGRWGLRTVLALARTLRRSRPDVVHVQFAPSAYGYSAAIGLLPLLLGRLPVVTTLHEYGWWSWPPRLPARVAGRLERSGRWDRETLALVPRSREVLVTNAGHQRVLAGRFPGRRAAVVPIGANVEPEPEPDVRARLRVPAGAPLLVFFGFVHPVKGIRHLLEAVAQLRAEWPELQLVLAGGFESLALQGQEAGEFEREVRGRIAELGLMAAVTVTGFRPAAEVSALLAAADAVVLPFTAGVTTKSGSLLAALAHGTPVAATSAEPPDPELVDGRTVVEIRRVRDADAIAAAVRRLLVDPALAARVAAGGRAVAATRSWPGIAAAHAELYRQVTGAGRR